MTPTHNDVFDVETHIHCKVKYYGRAMFLVFDMKLDNDDNNDDDDDNDDNDDEDCNVFFIPKDRKQGWHQGADKL